MKNELMARIERLETVSGLQQQLIDRLAIAVRGQEQIIEVLVQRAGVDLQPVVQLMPLNRTN